MNKSDFTNIMIRSKDYKFNSLRYVGYKTLSKYRIEINDENIILLYGRNRNFGIDQYHYAFNNLDYFSINTENKTDFLITFVDDNLIEKLKSAGFEIFAIWRDYFNHDISSFVGDEDFKYLKKKDNKRASDITLACKNQSRGFMGQTKKWIAEWMNEKNDEVVRMNVRNSTILTHSIEGEVVGIICIGVYGNQRMPCSTLWVADLAVHPDFQRRKIATKLMTQALNYGRVNGATRAFLMADETNLGALHLYEKMGFVGNEEDYEINMIKASDKKAN